jgi:hypothetical protein
MNMINREQERERALIFSERKTIVHISKEDGLFLNGIIIEIGQDFFILKDRQEGREYMILFSELKHSIDIFKERGE